MFSLPSTPAVQTRSAARSRYNSDTSPAHPQSSFPLPIDPVLTNPTHTQTPSATPTRARDHTDSVSSIRSTDHTLSPGLSATAASPTHTVTEGFPGIHTPFVQHAAPPSASNSDTPQQGQQASPSLMPGYHPDTPSPPAHYGGINGANLVVSDTSVMPSGNGVACQPLVNDVFSTGKSRPALRPCHSHNTVLTPNTNTFTSWSRRIVSEDVNNNGNGNTRSVPAPISVGHPGSETQPLALSATYPNTPLSQQGSVHDSSAPFSSSIPATHGGGGGGSAYPPPPPSSASHPHHHSSSHTQPMSMSGTPYSDQEVSFQSSTYAGSYESSFGSNSPWTPQSAEIGGHHHYHPYYAHAQAMSNKIEEPILAPGEVPAPRPPMSYAALIGEALLLAPPPHQLYVSEISDSIKKRYAYYRQNPTKVYNGVRHQTSMCKAFVKLPRPFGDQSGGARKWAIRAGCETYFQGGGYHPPGSNAAANMKKAGSPPANGKAKQTARSKQLAIGTSSSHSPKISANKIKTDPYIPSLGGGPSVGPAYDGSGKPYYPPYGHTSVPQYTNHYGGQPGSQGGYYAYQPIPYGHGYAQQPQWAPYGASAPAPGSPASQNEHSPQVSATGYHGYPYPSPYSQPGVPPHPYVTQGEYKPYAGMAPPHMSHHAGPGFPQSDERPNTQGSHGSQASYDGKLSPDAGDRAASVELSPRH